MKDTFILLTMLCTLISCQNSSFSQNNSNDTIVHATQSIGGNKDKHGCLTAAGQTWSQIKNDCIQVFSVGIRLNPVEVDSSEAIISAFVVPNEDSTAFELFLADKEESLILAKSSNKTFSNGPFKFDQKSRKLYSNDSLIYIAE